MADVELFIWQDLPQAGSAGHCRTPKNKLIFEVVQEDKEGLLY